jgi:Nif-specific regulatory protein
VLQSREYERLGATKSMRANVRMIAATNKDLEKAMGDQAFREDLYYRLNVFSIFIPPLRERKPDLLLLAIIFLTRASLAHGKHIKRISTPAIDMLMSYHWPGQRARAGERRGARRGGVRRAGGACPPSAAHAARPPRRRGRR